MLDVCAKQDPPACEQASKVMTYDQAHKTIRGLSSATDTPRSFELAAAYNILLNTSIIKLETIYISLVLESKAE